MNRNNNLYLIIGALLVIVAGLGYYMYKKEKQPDGVNINIGSEGVKVEGN